ncbi:hypothetical protein FOZ62_026640 [Perkinsus olseni]|uniref:Uncharacterized protein n=3 Tax=Perkinsus olseni TaxID=32597 RepID=A0A7J6U2F2_PEROL|nr:hypothetical protein FOZ62_026640 [Perkinsus olseni]
MVLSTVQSLCTGTMDDEVNDCLESLIGVADEEPAYFRPYLAELCRTGFGIAQAKDAIEDGPRQLAFEMITSLAEKKAKMCMKVPNFITDAVKTCLIFMLEIDGDGDDTEAWCKRFADQDDDEDVTNYEVGEENIDRFAQALGAEKTLPVVFQTVAEFVRIGTWKHKVAAIMTLSQVAEVVEEETQMDEIVKLLLQHMGDQHPRVRYAALHAMGQTATDCTPYVQEAWSQEVLTALEKAMDDPIPRVASHACAAFVNYAEDVEQEALIPHVKTLMEKLYRKLQMDQPRQIREQAITAIAVIAGVSESHFVSYYSHIMPLLKQTVQQASSKEERTLRGKAFECLSLLGLAVGKEVFANDAVEAMQAIVSMLREPEKHFEDDDPLKGFVLESLQRISKTLGPDFGQFLPALLPLILNQFSLTAAEVDDANEEQDMTMIMLAEGKCVGLKTSAIEDLASALQTISCFVENCGPAVYNPYVKDTALKLRPLLDFQFDDEVKSLAVNVWSELISCARRANDTATVKDLLNSFIESMLKAMSQEDELELLEAESRGIANCIKNAGPGTLSEQTVSHIVEVCFNLLKESFNRRADATAEEESGECDEDEVDEIRNIKEMDECVRIAITEIGGALMREHKQLFVSTGGLQKSIELVQKLIDTRCMAQDRCLALYIACDFLECLGADSVQAWGIFMEPMVAAITDNNPSLRQAAAYGANVACNIPQFGDIAATAAAQLYRAMQRPDARNKDNIAAHENAVAALGNVCEKFEQRLGNDAGNYWAAWIKNLPLKQDEDEGKKTHAQLVRLVKEQRPGVLGANNGNLGAIVHVLALVYKKDYSNALIDRAICEILAGLGEATIGGLQGSLNEKSKKGVMRILNDAKSV